MPISGNRTRRENTPGGPIRCGTCGDGALPNSAAAWVSQMTTQVYRLSDVIVRTTRRGRGRAVVEFIPTWSRRLGAAIGTLFVGAFAAGILFALLSSYYRLLTEGPDPDLTFAAVAAGAAIPLAAVAFCVWATRDIIGISARAELSFDPQRQRCTVRKALLRRINLPLDRTRGFGIAIDESQETAVTIYLYHDASERHQRAGRLPLLWYESMNVSKRDVRAECAPLLNALSQLLAEAKAPSGSEPDGAAASSLGGQERT